MSLHLSRYGFLGLALFLAVYLQPVDLFGSDNTAVFMLFGLAVYALISRIRVEPSLEVSGFEHAVAQILIVIGALIILLSSLLPNFHDLLFIMGFGPLFIGLAIPIFHFRASLKLFVPVLILFMLIPVMMIAESALSYPMRRLSAVVVGWLLNLTGWEVLVRGTELIGQNIRVSVTSACDGLTLFMHLIWIAWLYRMLNQNSGNGLYLALLLFPATLIANTLRIITLYLASQYWGVEVLTSFFHELVGWLAVALAVFVYMSFASISLSAVKSKAVTV